jgi:hypothetical protein
MLRRRQPLRTLRKRAGCRTEKAGFLTEDEALRELNWIARLDHRDSDHIPVRAYECGFCKLWHLTSSEYSGT